VYESALAGRPAVEAVLPCAGGIGDRREAAALHDPQLTALLDDRALDRARVDVVEADVVVAGVVGQVVGQVKAQAVVVDAVETPTTPRDRRGG